MPPFPTPPPDQLVTSSDLVRHFGLWQERAARAPLYILHRGRPRFVLTSIETMEALCAPHARENAHDMPRAIDPTILLDTVSDLVLVADRDGRIIATSRAARAHFGDLAEIGAPIDTIAPPGIRTLLGEAIRRVADNGAGDQLEIPSAARPTRTLLLTLQPGSADVLIVAQDGTSERERANALATEHALDVAMRAAAGLATVTINPRGYIATPTEALAMMTGLERTALLQIRFVALASGDARAALGAALERALCGDAPPALDIALLVNRADPIAVRIALAPIRSGAAVTGVVGVIVAH